VTAQSKEILIERIIGDALGMLADWSKPVALSSVGPKFPELGEQFSNDIQDIKQELREILSLHTVESLKSRYFVGKCNGTKTLRDP